MVFNQELLKLYHWYFVGILNKNDKNTNGTLIYKPMVRTKKSGPVGKK